MDGRPSRKGGQNPAYRPSRRLHSWADSGPLDPLARSPLVPYAALDKWGKWGQNA